MYPQDQQPPPPPPPPMQPPPGPPPGPQPTYPSQPPPQYQQPYAPPPPSPPPPQPRPRRVAAPGESFYGSPGIEKSRWEELALMGMRLVAWIYLALKVVGALFALIWTFTDNAGEPISFILRKLGDTVNELMWGVLIWALFMVIASIADSLIMLRKGQGRV